MTDYKMVYLTPHIDNEGLTIHFSKQIYDAIDSMIQEAYEGNPWESFITEILTDTHLFANRDNDVDPLEIVFGKDFVEEAKFFDEIMYRISFRRTGEFTFTCGNDHRSSLVLPRVPYSVSQDHVLAYKVNIAPLDDWLAEGIDEGGSIRNLSYNLSDLLTWLIRENLYFKSYFWINLVRYIHPPYLINIFESEAHCPPFRVYDENGDDIALGLDSIHDAHRTALDYLEEHASYHEYANTLTVGNVYGNDVYSVDLED